jgi:hypothetical protein
MARVLIPSSVHARKMRMAISPRFAAMTFLNFLISIKTPPEPADSPETLNFTQNKTSTSRINFYLK